MTQHTFPALDTSNTFNGANDTFGNGLPDQNVPAGDAPHLFEIVNDNSVYQVIRISTYGTPVPPLQGQNNMHWFIARGTQSVPTAIKSGDFFMSMGTRGWDGTVSSLSSGAYQAQATEDWNATSHGTKFHWETTPNGSTTRTGIMDFLGTGVLSVPSGLVLGGGTTLATTNQNGTGNIVMDTSPTLTTPVIGVATGTSLSVSGQLTSTVSTGTAPLAVSSTTNVANLNASSLSGKTFASPAAIGTGTPAAIIGTTITANTSLVVNGGTALTTSSQTGTGNIVLATTPTVTSPVINGTPSGTGIPTITLKKGSGGGDYTHSGDTNYSQVDGTNLTYTVTIPTGWKLVVQASGSIGTNTGTTTATVAVADGGSILAPEIRGQNSTAGNVMPFSILTVISGDGASHTIDLRYKTANSSDAVDIPNGSATLTPTMVFTLAPSN